MRSTVSPELVRLELEKLLASATLVNAPRLSRFLRFVVEQTLAGAAADIKEYPIGVEVFDRGVDFDPRLDPVVRVEARRLRAKLAEYYETEGRDDALQIRLSKGSYVPVFSPKEAAKLEPRRLPKWAVLAFAVVIALVIVAGAVYLTASQRREPVLLVLPTTAPYESDEAIRFGQGVSEDLTALFARSGRVRVIPWPSITAYQTQHQNVSFMQLAGEMHAEYVVAVSVREQGHRARILAHLIAPAKNAKIWAADYDRQITDDRLSTESELARQMADEILDRLQRSHP
jgi:adenylate cyclase